MSITMTKKFLPQKATKLLFEIGLHEGLLKPQVFFSIHFFVFHEMKPYHNILTITKAQELKRCLSKPETRYVIIKIKI